MKQRISSILLKNETRTLAGGTNYGKLFVLAGIYGFALLSLGINSGFMEHLTEKMESPYMRLVEVQNSVEQASLDSIRMSPKFQANKIPRISYWKSPAFVALPSNDPILADLLYVESAHYDSILTLIDGRNDNFVLGEKGFRSKASHPGAIIIAESFAKKVGFLQNPGTGYLQINQLGTKVEDLRDGINFPVAAVVKKLPQNADILITEETWSVLKSKLNEPGYTSRFQRDCYLITANDTTRAQDSGYYILLSEMETAPTIEERYIITIPPGTIGDAWPQIEFLSKDLSIYGKSLRESSESPTGVFIYFPSGSLVSLPREYANALESACEAQMPHRKPIQLNLTDIESKRNLGIISGLTQVLTIAISLLALSFVITFVLNLLLQHIANNGPNIGTLQAFGISNEYIILLYSKIGLILISAAFIMGVIFCLALGPLVLDGVLNQIGLGDEAEHISFSIKRPIALTSAFIVLPLTVVYFTLKSKLSHSKPGDLIYSRNNLSKQ